MILNERETEQGLLVAVCDPDLLGETIEDDGVSITVSPEFYGEEEAETEAVVDSLRRAAVANIVGREAVALAVEHGVIDEAHVLDIGSTRHAQLLRMG